MQLVHPASPICRRVYRLIQSHCLLRHSTRVGDKLRSIVGDKGDISSLAPSALASKFAAHELVEAERLVRIANENRRRPRRDE